MTLFFPAGDPGWKSSSVARAPSATRATAKARDRALGSIGVSPIASTAGGGTRAIARRVERRVRAAPSASKIANLARLSQASLLSGK
jgi:hypothetical protein